MAEPPSPSSRALPGRRRAIWLLLALLGLGASTATATHVTASDTDGHTTVEQVLVPADPDAPYTVLQVKRGGEPYIVRAGGEQGEPEGLPAAQPGRHERRKSLAYVSQLTDFQLADEESPARVEFADPGAASAWRPQEGFTAFQIDATIRQINHFAGASPVPQGDGTRAAMDFALLTGDQADNQHLNETIWVRDLLEGNGPLKFNSGLSDPADYTDPSSLGAACALFVETEGGAEAAAEEGARYTGVQDYSDYPLAPPATPLYYDPDEPKGQWEAWPRYGGLMDRAQQIELDPVGLDVPFYITNGNHDVLVQGNEDANRAFEDIATGCFKALATVNDPTAGPPGEPDPNDLLSPANVGMLVPPDPARRFVSKPEIKDIYGATEEGPGDDDHGFAFVDAEENEASNGSASYYAWDPPQTPGITFISIDTNSEGGQTLEGVGPGSANGNLDDPQFQWLKRKLAAARARDQMVVLFGHHPVRSMTTQIRDEQAVPCTVDDEHGHDTNPGCDLDPRPSDDDPATEGVGCIHNGEDAHNNTCPNHESFVDLMDQFPNVIAYVPGHTHDHRLTPFVRSDGSTWWEINTSAVIDNPNQSRLVEFMDNRDGTLSIFNTVVDHAAPATAPAACPDSDPDCALDFTADQLGAIGRTFSYNDPQTGAGTGTGAPKDRNAELVLEDPRPVADLGIVKSDTPDPAPVGRPLAYTLSVTNHGPNRALETVVTDELPATVDPVAAESTYGVCGISGQTATCELDALAAGTTAQVTITVVPRQVGEIVNSASVRANVSDRVPANDAATQTTTIVAAVDDGSGGGGGGQGGGGATGGGQTGGGLPRADPDVPACASAAGFRSVGARGAGRGVRLSFVARGLLPVHVDVFQVSRGRSIVGQRLVARFRNRESSFRWNGRANRPGRRVRDGYYFARFTTGLVGGGNDVRRVTLRRHRGRWISRPPFAQRTSCDLLESFKLQRPVFGGRANRSLRISYRLARRSRVTVHVLRRKKVVARLRARGTPRVRHRLTFRARGRRRGDYRVRLRATGRRKVVTRTLVSRRL